MAWPAKAAHRPTVMRDGTKVGEGMTMEGGGGGWRDAGHDRHSLALLLVACNVTTPYLGVPRWRRRRRSRRLAEEQDVGGEARNPGVPRWKRRRRSRRSWTEEGVGSRWVMPPTAAAG